MTTAPISPQPEGAVVGDGKGLEGRTSGTQPPSVDAGPNPPPSKSAPWGLCPMCHTPLNHASGLAIWCPNERCTVDDGPGNFAWREQAVVHAADCAALSRPVLRPDCTCGLLPPAQPPEPVSFPDDMLIKRLREAAELAFAVRLGSLTQPFSAVLMKAAASRLEELLSDGVGQGSTSTLGVDETRRLTSENGPSA